VTLLARALSGNSEFRDGVSVFILLCLAVTAVLQVRREGA